ncbi:MAG: YgfZ/GcvT domain-containing protein [Solirubrobacterales bacterium]
METGTAPALERDYAAITGGAGLLDRSARGKLDVAGPDAAEFLQGQVTNDVVGLAPGEGCYAALLDPKAHILADVRILSAGAGELWLDTEPQPLHTVLRHLRMHKIGRQVEVSDRTTERAILSLLGPAAGAVAARATGAVIPATEHDWVDGHVGNVTIRVAVTGAGVDLFAPTEAAGRLSAALLEAGAQSIGDEAAEVLRVERGVPLHGIDMGPDNLPGEAGIVERAVSFTKGCYVGQEPVARMYHRGRPNRRLRGLRLSAPVSPGQPIRSGDKEVGSLTSSVTSPRLGPIGLAIVRREVEEGDEVLVGAGVSAAVVELPFHPT